MSIITLNLDISKCFEGEKIITVGSILKSDKPIFPTFSLIPVDACQRVVARQKTTPLHILSIIAVLSGATTMSQFPLHGRTIFLGFDYYVFTHYFLSKNIKSGIRRSAHYIWVCIHIQFCWTWLLANGSRWQTLRITIFFSVTSRYGKIFAIASAEENAAPTWPLPWTIVFA